VTQYLNDGRGRNIGVTDPLSNSSVYTYDGQYRKITELNKKSMAKGKQIIDRKLAIAHLLSKEFQTTVAIAAREFARSN
jgi:YD repeat-containing protein